MGVPEFSSNDLVRAESRVLPVAIPLAHDVLNTVTQVRKKIEQEEIVQLAESIRHQGQQTPARVVALQEGEARQYLREINLLWKGSAGFRRVSFSQLKSVVIDQVEYYLIVVFGHRRLEACRYAYQNNWLSDKFQGEYHCDIHFGLSVREAIPMQLAENFYVPVAKHEEIAAMWRFWLYQKQVDPGLTRATFAHMVGRTPGWVREMLHFTDLPSSIQQRIQPDAPGGAVAYSLILQVARLARGYKTTGKYMSEDDMARLIDWLLARRVSATVFAKEVTERLAQLQEGQSELFAESQITSRQVRKTAQRQLVPSMMLVIQYIRRIHNMMAHTDAFGGKSPYAADLQLGPGEYSPHSPGRMSLRVLELYKEIVPLIAIMVERDGISAKRLREELLKLGITEAVFRAHVETLLSDS